MGAGVAPPLTLVTLNRTSFNIITKSVGETVVAVYSPAVLRLRDHHRMVRLSMHIAHPDRTSHGTPWLTGGSMRPMRASHAL